MLKFSFAFSLVIASAASAQDASEWYMVRTAFGQTGVVGTFAGSDAQAKCEAALADLKTKYAPGNQSKVSGRTFGERDCRNEWPK